MKSRPHILDKPRFLESALQKWLAIFLFLIVGVGVAGSHGWMSEAKAVLDAILQVASLGILAIGGTNSLRVMKSGPKPDDVPAPTP